MHEGISGRGGGWRGRGPGAAAAGIRGREEKGQQALAEMNSQVIISAHVTKTKDVWMAFHPPAHGNLREMPSKCDT